MDLMSLYEKCEQDKELFLFSSDNIQKIFGVLFLNSDEKIFKTKIRYNEDIYHIELKKEENRILAFVDKEKVLEIRDGNVVFIKQKSKIVYYFLYPFLKEFNYENEKIIRDGFVVDENAQPLDLERKIVLKYLPKCIISEGAEKHIDTVNKMLFELRLNNKLSEEELNFILSSSSYYYFNIIKLSVLLFDTENFLKNLKQIKFLIEKGNRYSCRYPAISGKRCEIFCCGVK